MSKTLITILLTSFVLILSGCISNVSKNTNESEVVNENVNEQMATSIDSPSEALAEVEEIDTSNWKTYRNEEYGFEFKYPEDWEYKNKFSDVLKDGFIEFWDKSRVISEESFPDLILNVDLLQAGSDVNVFIGKYLEVPSGFSFEEFLEKYPENIKLRKDVLEVNKSLYSVIYKKDRYELFNYYFFEEEKFLLVSIVSPFNVFGKVNICKIIESFDFF